MEFEIDNTTLVVVILVLIVIFVCWSNKSENWTHLGGAPQKWRKIPREETRCDTGFNDDICKYTAINCLNNQHSSLYGA